MAGVQRQAVEGAASSVAALIGADPDEVIFTSGATEANNLALLGLARRTLPQRRRILVSAIEHKCVLAAARSLEERDGFTVETIPVDGEGLVDLGALEDMLDERVLVASVMAVNNEIGTIQDIPRIATLLRRHNVLFHCDAAQAPCAMDVSDLARHADLISLSAHKIYGPQGIGALYIRREIQECIEPIIYGGGQQAGLRSGTVPVPLCVGMAAAAEIVGSLEGTHERERVGRQRDSFIEMLQGSGFPVAINGPVSSGATPATPICDSTGLWPKTYLGHFNHELPPPRAQPARLASRSHPTYFVPSVSTRHRPNRQSALALVVSPLTKKSKKPDGWSSKHGGPQALQRSTT